MRVLERHVPARDKLQVGLEPMFRDFYRAMTGDALNDAQIEVLQELMQDLHSGEQA